MLNQKETLVKKFLNFIYFILVFLVEPLSVRPVCMSTRTGRRWGNAVTQVTRRYSLALVSLIVYCSDGCWPSKI